MKISNCTLFLLLSALFILSSCDKDDPDITNEDEVITTLIYTLTPSSGGETVTLMFEDLDGDAGNDPIINSGTLVANESYSGSLELSNKSGTETIDITEEIQEEDLEHQFFFQSSIADLVVNYADQDSEENPVGLASELITGAAGSGELTIILRHEPAKSAAGVSDGDITNAGGSTDIEVSFTIDVE